MRQRTCLSAEKGAEPLTFNDAKACVLASKRVGNKSIPRNTSWWVLRAHVVVTFLPEQIACQNPAWFVRRTGVVIVRNFFDLSFICIVLRLKGIPWGETIMKTPRYTYVKQNIPKIPHSLIQFKEIIERFNSLQHYSSYTSPNCQLYSLGCAQLDQHRYKDGVCGESLRWIYLLEVSTFSFLEYLVNQNRSRPFFAVKQLLVEYYSQAKGCCINQIVAITSGNGSSAIAKKTTNRSALLDVIEGGRQYIRPKQAPGKTPRRQPITARSNDQRWIL